MRIAIPLNKLPKFASEEEEANWWPAHPEFGEELFRQADLEGKLEEARISKATIRLSEASLSKALAVLKKAK
jgi:hypothetical protein